MDQQNLQANSMQRRMSNLVLAEMFLLQATIESATAIGDGLQSLRRNLRAEDSELPPGSGLSNLLEHTLDSAIEPYTARYHCYRQLTQDHA